MIGNHSDRKATPSRVVTLLDEATRQTIEQRLANRLKNTRGRIDRATRQLRGEGVMAFKRFFRNVDQFGESATAPNHHFADMEAVAIQMVSEIYDKLAVRNLSKPAADRRSQLEHLAEACSASSEFIRKRVEAWRFWLKHGIAINIEAYGENPGGASVTESLNQPARVRPYNSIEQAREKRLALYRSKAREEVSERVFDLLGMPPSMLLVRPWLTHERLETQNVDQLYAEVPQAFLEITISVVQAFLQAIVTGQEKRIYGDIAVGDVSIKYTFATFRIVDKLGTELVSRKDIISDTAYYNEEVERTEGTRTTYHVFSEHQLLHPAFFTFDATLMSPALEIPPHFRAYLEQAPDELRPHLFGIFGKQILERTVAHEIDSTTVLEETVIARYLYGEPCVVFGGSVVLFGWGERLMTQTQRIYSEHREILDQERELLANAHRAHGAYSTTLRWGLGLLALAIVELFFAIVMRSFGAVFVLLPVLLFGATALYLTQVNMRVKWKGLLLHAKITTEDGFQALTEKYPAFDPHQPRVLPPDTDGDSSV